jgi:MFS family permease
MKVPAPLRYPDFRSIWVAGLISDTGDWLLFIALPVVVYDLTGSALGTSFAFLVELVPGILLAPLAGRLADRWDRRRLLFAVSVAQALALLPLLAVHSRSDLSIVYAVILVEAAFMALFDPAKNAMLPTLLPADELVSANALVGLNQNIGRLVGGPLGGVVLAVGGLRLTVFADIVSYLLAAAFISRLSARARSGDTSAATPGGDRGAAGFITALRNRRARPSLLVAFTGQIAQGIFVVLFVLFVARQLHRGAAEIGLLRGVQAIGAIAGSLVLTAVARRANPTALTAWAAITFGVLSFAVWNAPTVSTATALYVGLFILVGTPGIVMSTGIVSSLQLATSDDERGRAFAALGLAGNAGQLIGMLAAGLLTAPLGLRTVLDTQAMLYLIAGVIAGYWMTNRAAHRPEALSTASLLVSEDRRHEIARTRSGGVLRTVTPALVEPSGALLAEVLGSTAPTESAALHRHPAGAVSPRPSAVRRV